MTVEKGRPVARGATILDYPDTPGKRGYNAFGEDDNATLAWFGATCLRANVVLYRQLRKSASWQADTQQRGKPAFKKSGRFSIPCRLPGMTP